MIRIAEYKEPQHNSFSEKFHDPSKLYLPLSQHTGAPSKPCVKKGDQVSEGEVIAKASGAISAQLHAPKSGKVIDIANWYHPTLKKAPAIIIQCQDEKKEYSPRKDKDIELLTQEKILKTIADCGLVGMGGAAFPTHVKLNPPKKIDTLIVGGVDKGFNFDKLSLKIAKSNITNIIYFPETGGEIAKKIGKINKKIKLISAQNMREAVSIAFQKTKKNKACVLSPGASSFNMFKNYKQRGNFFKKYVQKN